MSSAHDSSEKGANHQHNIQITKQSERWMDDDDSSVTLHYILFVELSGCAFFHEYKATHLENLFANFKLIYLKYLFVS